MITPPPLHSHSTQYTERRSPPPLTSGTYRNKPNIQNGMNVNNAHTTAIVVTKAFDTRKAITNNPKDVRVWDSIGALNFTPGTYTCIICD